MENQSTNSSQSSLPLSVQYEVCEDNIRTEITSEYTLPDYSPEIRKLLRVQTKIVPTRKYVSSGKAEFSGNVVYTILYSGDDGSIAATCFNGDYEISFPLPANAGSEPSVSVTGFVESCNCRLVGPRRISARTRLKFRTCCTASTPLSKENGDELRKGEEKLRKTIPISETVRINAEEFSVSEKISADGYDTDKLFPIACDGSVRIGEAFCENGKINVRGEIWTNCLLSDGNGAPPLKLSRKIPFEEELYSDKIAPDFDCRIDGVCHTVDVRTAETESGNACLEISAVYSLEAQARHLTEIEITEDMYSCRYNSNCDFENVDVTRSLCLGNGNLSVSATSPLPDGISDNADVADVGGEVKIISVISEKDGCKIEGECNLTAVCSQNAIDNTNQLLTAQVRTPFKCVIPSKYAEDVDWDCKGELLGVKARIDNKNIVFDLEIALSYSVLERQKIKCVSSFSADTSAPLKNRSGKITICRTKSGDSLWSICRRFGITEKSLCEFNDITSEQLPEILLIR